MMELPLCSYFVCCPSAMIDDRWSLVLQYLPSPWGSYKLRGDRYRVAPPAPEHGVYTIVNSITAHLR